jgi:hypothetical protein
MDIVCAKFNKIVSIQEFNCNSIHKQFLKLHRDMVSET